MKAKGKIVSIETNDESSVQVSYRVDNNMPKRRVVTNAAIVKAIGASDDFVHILQHGIKDMNLEIKVDKNGKVTSPKLSK